MFISTAYAQAANGAPGGASAFMQLLPLLAIFVIFYFFLIRPQQKRTKQHREMVNNVKRGDTVVTSGGLIGKVTRVDDAEVQVEIANGVHVQVVKSTLADVRTKGEPANDVAKN